MDIEKTIKITNVKQFECLVQCMEKNVEVAKGYFNFGSSKLEFNYRIAEKLNSLGSPIRDGSGWQKAWTDFKGKLKKMGQNKKEITATGSGACRLHTFSPLEESVIRILNLNSIFPKNYRTFGLSAVATSSTSSSTNVNSDPNILTRINIPPDNGVAASENRDFQIVDDEEESASNYISRPKRIARQKLIKIKKKYSLLETQTKYMEETLKYVKESARYSRKMFELKEKKFNN